MGLTSPPPIWTMSVNILFLGAKAPLELAHVKNNNNNKKKMEQKIF